MNIGPNGPSGSGGGKGRRRRGRRGAPGGRPGGHPGQGQPGNNGAGGHGGHGSGRTHGHGGHSGQSSRGARNRRGGAGGAGQDQHGHVFTRPMDHAYRNGQQQDFRGNRGHRPGMAGSPYMQPDPEPVVHRDENAAPRIFAFVDDLFFLAKIQEVARKLNVKVEFVKSDKEILERVKTNGEEKPSLIIIDLNNNSIKPLTIIPKLKRELKRGTAIIGFLSHVQGELKVKAQEAGCDMVLPRSAFSQNLPSLLRRHGATSEAE